LSKLKNIAKKMPSKINPETLPCASNITLDRYPEWDSKKYTCKDDDDWAQSIVWCYD